MSPHNSLIPAARITLLARRHATGVSLIELMVSLVIGSMLIIGAVTVYMQSRNTYRTNEAAARLQETARYALDVIEPDVRMAGYWGLTNRAEYVENRGTPAETAQTVATGVTNNCGTNWTVDAMRYLDGRDHNVTGYDLACAATDPAGWADVLIVRRTSSNASALTNNRFQVQSNRIRAVIFKDGTLPGGFAVAPGSETHDLLVHAYYISNPAGTNQFALRRQTLNGVTIEDQEIIQGVEDLQVQFGVDVNGDDNADQYVNTDGVPAGAQIVSARIWLLVVAPDIEVGFVDGTDYAYANAAPGTFADSRRRLLVSKTIQIRNSTL
jgi:type IV pilus assembly protein PilW